MSTLRLDYGGFSLNVGQIPALVADRQALMGAAERALANLEGLVCDKVATAAILRDALADSRRTTAEA